MSDATENEKEENGDTKTVIDDSAFEALEKEFQVRVRPLVIR